MLLHYNVGPGLQRVLDDESSDGVTVDWTPEGDDAAWFAAMAEAGALLHVLEPVTAAAMDAAPGLRLIQKLGVGVNTIDLDAARARGIAVANLPGSNAIAVAEHTLGLLLAVLRRIPSFDRELRAGRNLTQAQLGEACGLHRTFIGSVERGERNLSVLNLRLIAQALRVPVPDLLPG